LEPYVLDLSRSLLTVYTTPAHTPVCCAFFFRLISFVCRSPLCSGALQIALFDREINLRRAASAAFQENVGRHSRFPHGLTLNTIADYYHLGHRTQTYLHISPKVAKYDLPSLYGLFPSVQRLTSKPLCRYSEYTQCLLDHLALVKSVHWEAALRSLSAAALGRLTPFDPEYVANKLLPALVSHKS
jgi:hypothetical protein